MIRSSAHARTCAVVRFTLLFVAAVMFMLTPASAVNANHVNTNTNTNTNPNTCDDLSGRWTGSTSGNAGPLIVVQLDGNLFTANAPGYWSNATGVVQPDGTTILGKGGWTHDNITQWTLVIGKLTVNDLACTKLRTLVKGRTVATWCRHDLTPTQCGAPLPVPIDGCPDQVGTSPVTAVEFGKIYASKATLVGVTFSTDDPRLQTVYDHAITCENANTQTFLPGLDNIVEGSDYKNVWLETQPMGGAMWAVRNLTRALANQLVFMRTQRADGRLPGMVTTNMKSSPSTTSTASTASSASSLTHTVDKSRPASSSEDHEVDGVRSADDKVDGVETANGWCANATNTSEPTLCAVYCTGTGSLLQGNYFSTTSVDVAWFLNVSDETTALEYTRELHGVLERFDDWMWNNRRSTLTNNSDILTCPSAADWGGDGYNGYRGYQAPFLSMDMMSYAHSNALALVRTSRMLNNMTGISHWSAHAATVAASLKRALWLPHRGAFYDVDDNTEVVNVLVHNNLRTMWHGAMSQAMASRSNYGTKLSRGDVCVNPSPQHVRVLDPLPSALDISCRPTLCAWLTSQHMERSL